MLCSGTSLTPTLWLHQLWGPSQPSIEEPAVVHCLTSLAASLSPLLIGATLDSANPYRQPSLAPDNSSRPSSRTFVKQLDWSLTSHNGLQRCAPRSGSTYGQQLTQLNEVPQIDRIKKRNIIGSMMETTGAYKITPHSDYHLHRKTWTAADKGSGECKQ